MTSHEEFFVWAMHRAIFENNICFKQFCLVSVNFQISLQDCVAARKDLELISRLCGAFSIGFRGLEYGLDPPMEKVRTSMIGVEIFSGDCGR